MAAIEIDIKQIIINDRIREDCGDLQELANDIEKNGLINPIALNQKRELIAGYRRIRAFELLGIDRIPFTMMETSDYQEMLELEIAENELRKDFTKEERVKYGLELERVEIIKARERKEATQFKQITDVQNFAPPQLDDIDTVVENFPPPEDTGKTRDIVAKKVGLGSGENYRKAKEIVKEAPEPIKDAWNRGEISTHRAFEITKAPTTEEEKLKAWQQEEIKKADRAIEDEYKLAMVISKFVNSTTIPYYKEITEEHLEAFYSYALGGVQKEMAELDKDCDLIIGICERIKFLNRNYGKVRLVK